MRFEALFAHYVYKIPSKSLVHMKHTFLVNVVEVKCDLSGTSISSIQLKRKIRKGMSLEKIIGKKEDLWYIFYNGLEKKTGFCCFLTVQSPDQGKIFYFSWHFEDVINNLETMRSPACFILKIVILLSSRIWVTHYPLCYWSTTQVGVVSDSLPFFWNLFLPTVFPHPELIWGLVPSLI